MTKTKKLLSVLLVGIILLFSVQPTAFAGIFDRKISDVEISINNAISGYFADEYEQFIEIKSKGIIFDNTGAEPFQILDGTYNMDGNPLISGETYTFRMRFVADKGYKFKGDSIKNLNIVGGRLLEYCINNAYDYEVSYMEIWCAVKIEDSKSEPLSQLDIEINSRIAGIKSNNKNGLSKINTEGVRLSSVICSEDDFSKVIYYSKYDGKFEVGKTYYFRFYYTANGGYNSDNLEKVIVNGEEYSNWRTQSSLEPGAKKQIMVEIPITVDGIYGKSIEELSFTFDNKLVDSEIHLIDIGDFVKVDTEHVKITRIIVNGVRNFGDKDTFLVSPGSRFDMEQIYRLTVYVKTDEGYTFNGLKKVIMNGKDITKSENGYANVVDEFGVYYDFIPREAELTFFKQVAKFFRNLFKEMFWFLD